jgi:hypothetical protein
MSLSKVLGSERRGDSPPGRENSWRGIFYALE